MEGLQACARREHDGSAAPLARTAARPHGRASRRDRALPRTLLGARLRPAARQLGAGAPALGHVLAGDPAVRPRAHGLLPGGGPGGGRVCAGGRRWSGRCWAHSWIGRADARAAAAAAAQAALLVVLVLSRRRARRAARSSRWPRWRAPRSRRSRAAYARCGRRSPPTGRRSRRHMRWMRPRRRSSGRSGRCWWGGGGARLAGRRRAAVRGDHAGRNRLLRGLQALQRVASRIAASGRVRAPWPARACARFSARWRSRAW